MPEECIKMLGISKRRWRSLWNISSQIDKSVVARLYKAKMVAYRDVFNHQSALEQAKTAAEYYS